MTDKSPPESRAFEADVSKLLHMLVHSVYSDKDVFLRELISNAADACEKLRYEAIANPALAAEDAAPRIALVLDPAGKTLTVEDNGIGMERDELVEALGTIARSGTKAFLEKLQGGENTQLIGQFGVGFYSVFMVADRVEVISRRAGSEAAWQWSSDGKGTFSVTQVTLADAPRRGTRVVLHLMDEAKSYGERATLERIAKAQSGHVPVPISIVEKDKDASQITDGAALWTKQKSEVSKADYTDFYRSVAGQFDEPALTVHFRAEGRHEYSVLAFVPGSRPFDLFDAERKGRFKLYVRRVFITDEADILPRYLRFFRGLVDSADLPLNVSREMIQESPLLAAIRRGVTNRAVDELVKLADTDAEAFDKVWENFGAVLKEGLYEDFERREQLLGLARFKTTTSDGKWRSLEDYAAALKENQTSIFFLAGDDMARFEASPHLEGFRARGVEVLLLNDPVDSFWVTMAPGFGGKPFKSVTQGGAADLAAIATTEPKPETPPESAGAMAEFVAFIKTALGPAVSDVRPSERLTDSAVCLVAPEQGPDRQLEKMLAGSGRLPGEASKPVLEINPRHALVAALAATPDGAFKTDAVHLLFDEARVLDGDRPADARAFSDRLARVLTQGIGKSGG